MIYTVSMKKLAVTAAVLAFIGVIGWLLYNGTQTYNQKQALSAEEQRKADVQAENKRLQEVQSFNKLHAECRKGKIAYDATTAVQKRDKKLEAPSCGDTR